MPGASAAVRIASALVLAACGSPPGSFTPDPDAVPPFDWVAVIDDAPESLLSTCGPSDQVTAVGGRDGHGFIVEWTGDGWYEPALPAGTPTLWWCASGAGATFAVGERGAVLRRDAAGWAADETGDAIPAGAMLYGVWADGGGLWVVGGEPAEGGPVPVIARRDASGWSRVDAGEFPPQVLFKVWGSGPADVWAVGTGGVILHFDGAAWSAVASPTVDRLIAVWGTSAADAYAVGGDGTGLVLRWDGVRWSRFAAAPEPLSGVWRASGGPLYVGGNRGWLGRFTATDGAPRAAELTSTVAAPDADIHALHGAGDAIIAVGADLLGGGTDSWRGHLLVHGDGYRGELERAPDAGPGDAGGPDGGGTQGPGDPCDGVQLCRDGLQCQWLSESAVSICTEPCDSATECGAYGPDACCMNPCWQGACPICIPGSYPECTP